MSAMQQARYLSTLLFRRSLSQRPDQAPLLNEAVARLRRIRLISETGEDCGEMPARAAWERARATGKDLMQVSAGGDGRVAVARLVDYAEWSELRRKSAYDAKKKRKEIRRLDRREGLLKQVRLSPVIDANDVAIKMRQAREFLQGGYRVRVYMQFRKGHGRLEADAKAALIRAAGDLEVYGKVQGVGKDLGIADLFRRDEELRAEAKEAGEPVKKKPLEILIFPLPRKQREAQVEADKEK